MKLQRLADAVEEEAKKHLNRALKSRKVSEIEPLITLASLRAALDGASDRKSALQILRYQIRLRVHGYLIARAELPIIGSKVPMKRFNVF